MISAFSFSSRITDGGLVYFGGLKSVDVFSERSLSGTVAPVTHASCR